MTFSGQTFPTRRSCWWWIFEHDQETELDIQLIGGAAKRLLGRVPVGTEAQAIGYWMGGDVLVGAGRSQECPDA